ncbi:MAG: patatin-like phospholipase family protein [Pseudomonadota bacterium]
MADTDNTFYLGLTMAGAISAGAYTAGVLDVLFEALDRHNARQAQRAADPDNPDFADYPRHKVVLRVISGTSAGGVSAGLSVAGLIDARREEDSADGLQIADKHDGSWGSGDYRYNYEYILKPLHYCWIEALDLWREEPGGPVGFLTLDDIDTDGDGHADADAKVVSALNTQHINVAADFALSDIRWNGKPYRFLDDGLDIFLTTTNLQGVPYEIGFAGAEEESGTHSMAQHSSVRHFRINGMGDGHRPSAWLDAWRDEGIQPGLPAPGDRVNFEDPAQDWHHFKTASIATGAFPVGLAPRTVEATAQDFGATLIGGPARGGAWPVNIAPVVTIDGVVKDMRPRASLGDTAPDDAVNYVAVDGGVANNEPFELARYTLRQPLDPDGAKPGQKFLKSNPREAHLADCAVIMVDPFPEGPAYSPLDKKQADALHTIFPAARRLLPALINQARFKPSELIEASSGDVRSRYLIAPSRRETAAEREARGGNPEPARVGISGSKAIASGSFGGFGGFFNRSFRAHDYMLGRRNMHSFLSNHLQIATSNSVLGRTDGSDDELTAVVQPGQDFVAEVPELPPWPRIGKDVLDPILKNAQVRVREVGTGMLRVSHLPYFLQVILGQIWRFDLLGVEGMGKQISQALRSIVMHELIVRDQHTDYRNRADGTPFLAWQRDILAALAQSGGTPMPVDADPDRERKKDVKDLLSVILSGGEDPDAVRHKRQVQLPEFIEELHEMDLLWAAPKRWGDDERYTLAAMKPEKTYGMSFKAGVSRIRNLFG